MDTRNNSLKTPTGGKILSFYLDQEEYAVEIAKVLEITAPLTPTPVPHSAAHILGVINLRGRIMPVIDLKKKLGLGQTETGPLSCLIVVCAKNAEAALLVDRVNEVRDLSHEKIQTLPELNQAEDGIFLLAMGQAGGKIKLLLNLDTLVESPDTQTCREQANAHTP